MRCHSFLSWQNIETGHVTTEHCLKEIDHYGDHEYPNRNRNPLP